MSLRDVQIKSEYRSFLDNMPRDFYIPLLSQSILYERAVGFFSSTILLKISQGIIQLVKNGGKIKLIATPYLSDEDINAIRSGYAQKDEVIKRSLFNELKAPVGDFEANRLNFLANLVADDILDIRIAIVENDSGIGMFHDKMGIFKDKEGNLVAFSGSMNETGTAVDGSYETIDVFTGWSSEAHRVADKVETFDCIWNDNMHRLHTMFFKELSDEIVRKYKRNSLNYNLLKADDYDTVDLGQKTSMFFKMPDSVSLYPYQDDAVNAWFGKNCFGIFDMATGSGKTYTALAAISRLSRERDGNLAVVIVVPYQHLVEQWVDDINLFNVQPIIAYSNYKWRQQFSHAVSAYNTGVMKNFCIITTNATFSLDDFQSILLKFKKDFLFVADEAHNLGAEKIAKLLPKRARFRLALSATVERYWDEEGTDIIRRYFGSLPCITFSLEDAINNGFLTPYIYHPIICYLDDDEWDKYYEISKQISILSSRKDEDDSKRELLLIKRARIIAGCRDKIPKLVECIKPYSNKTHILVYCGATRYDHGEIGDGDDIRQIEEVNLRLYHDLGMRVHKFTSVENKEERNDIKSRFVSGDLQVLTAIKCLDEGVNIPAISTAFILASSTNPKEYIQRRGRILRLADGKKYAEIFDFITLPRKLEMVKYCNESQVEIDLSLVRKEFDRMSEFARVSLNPHDVDELKGQIMSAYRNINNAGGTIYD